MKAQAVEVHGSRVGLGFDLKAGENETSREGCSGKLEFIFS